MSSFYSHSLRSTLAAIVSLLLLLARASHAITEVIGSGDASVLMINQSTTTFTTTVVAELRPWIAANAQPGAQITSTACSGTDFALMALSSNQLIAWGSNTNGQLGISNSSSGSTVYKYPLFVNVTALQGRVVSNVTCLATSAVLATTDGRLYAWGLNSVGQLGVGDLVTRYEPTPVVMTDTLSLAFNASNCTGLQGSANFVQMLCDSGTRIVGWGANNLGQLGIGSVVTPQPVPVRTDLTAVTGTVVQLAVGPVGSAALINNGTHLVPYVWGGNNAIRANCRATASTTTPTRVDTTDALYSDSQKPARMFWRTLLYFIRTNQTGSVDTSVWACSNSASTVPQLQTGLGDVQATFGASAADPITIVDSHGYQNMLLVAPVNSSSTRLGSLWVAASSYVEFNLTRGSVSLFKTYGSNTNFFLAVRSTPAIPENYPNRAPRLQFTDSIYSLIQKPTANVTKTSDNTYIFNGVSYLTRAIVSGGNHTLLLLNNSIIVGFGDNSAGQIAPPSASVTYLSEPVGLDPALFGNKTPVKVVAGRKHSAVLTSDGTLYLWGGNTAGQLCWGPANETAVAYLNDTALSMRTGPGLGLGGNISDVWAGWDGTMFKIRDTGKVYSCGSHLKGQLGTSTPFANLTTPTAIFNVTGQAIRYRDVVDVFMGEEATHMIADDYYYGDRKFFRTGNDGCVVSAPTSFAEVTYLPAAGEVDVIKVGSTATHTVFWYTDTVSDNYGSIFGCNDPRYLRGYTYPPAEAIPDTGAYRPTLPGELVLIVYRGKFQNTMASTLSGASINDTYQVYDIAVNKQVGTYFALKSLSGPYNGSQFLYQTGVLIQQVDDINTVFVDPTVIPAEGDSVKLLSLPQRLASPVLFIATASIQSPVAPPVAVVPPTDISIPPAIGVKPSPPQANRGLSGGVIATIVVAAVTGAIAVVVIALSFRPTTAPVMYDAGGSLLPGNGQELTDQEMYDLSDEQLLQQQQQQRTSQPYRRAANLGRRHFFFNKRAE